MNPPKQINRKRLAGLLISWTIYAGLIWWLSYQEQKVCLFGILALSSINMLLSLYLLWRPIRTTTVALIAGLVFLQAPARAKPQPQEEEPLLVECAVAAVVIGVGAVIIISLVRVCNRCLPPTQPPDQPPATNTTNAPPATNAAPRRATLALSDSAISYYDVSSLTLSNVDKAGNPYRVWFQGKIESSTNLRDWKTEFSINGWASITQVVMVYADESGVPISTNWSTLTSGTNTCYVPTVTANEQAKFFRAVPQ